MLGIQVLVPLGKEKFVLYSEIAGALINLAANMLLIPRFAALGAAMGTLIAEAVVLIVQFYVLRKAVKQSFVRLPYIKIAFGLVVALAATAPINLFCDFGLFLNLAVNAVVFFGVYGLVLYLTQEALVKQLCDQFLSKVMKTLR